MSVMDHPNPDGRSLGLKRGTVALLPYDPSWAVGASSEVDAIRRALGAIAEDVQHVGSTAVPGLESKPILDIAAAVRAPLEQQDIVVRLADAGYVFRGDKGTEGGLLFVRTDTNDVRTVHVHVVAADSVEWRNYLRFRDVLQRDPQRRHEYERLKRELADRYPNDRPAYTAGKRLFIQRVLSAPDTYS
jgi:GrpB-like predicted nucleotidyltransferase (UPF0157 family)